MLNMRQKKAITEELKKRYAKLSKKEKGLLLNQFCALTGYNRSYAARKLRLVEGKAIGYTKIGGKKVKFVISKNKKIKRKGKKIYDYDVFLALRKIWVICDCICGKRLAPFMAEIIEKLEAYGEINLEPIVKKNLKK